MAANMSWCRLLSLSLRCKAVQHAKSLPVTCTLYRFMSSALSAGYCGTAPLLPVATVSARHYAKAKDRKKSDKGKKKAVVVNEEVLSEVFSVDSMKLQMQKTVDNMKDDFMRNLSLRSTIGSIETIPVSFEGKEYMLQELAQVGRKNPKTVIIMMTEFPQAIPAVLTSIKNAGMNLNPQQDGTTLFIPVPKVTKEHRENLAKNAKALFVKYRDSVKDIQNKYLKQVKRNSSISEDLSHEVQDQIITIAHQYVIEMDKVLEAKQVELLGKQ